MAECLLVRENCVDKLFLTEREVEVLKLMAEGKNNIEIGAMLFISMHTAKAHVGHIIMKLNAKDRVNAVAIAIRRGII